jgi:endonuclease/exonuclease/phosphatase (EEP) superfamily protein YafD
VTWAGWQAAAVYVVGWLVVAAVVAAGTSMMRMARPWPAVVLQGFMPWLAVGAVAVTVVAMLVDNRWLTAAAMGATAFAVAQIVRLPRSPESIGEPPAGSSITVAAANVLYGNPRRDEAIDALLALDADVLMLIEVTPAWADAIARSPLHNHYPHKLVVPARHGDGAAVLSKLPLSEERKLTSGRQSVVVTVSVDGEAIGGSAG